MNLFEELGKYGVQCSLTGELAPTKEFAQALAMVEQNHNRYLALRDKSTKDLGVRRKSGWTYIQVTGAQLDRAADVLASKEDGNGGQHHSLPSEEGTKPELG